MFAKIERKLTTARARQALLVEGLGNCQRKCEKARAALGGEATTSNESDPIVWETGGFVAKSNRWVQPEDLKKDEEDVPAKSGSESDSSVSSSASSSSDSSDSSEESKSSTKSDAPMSDEVRAQRIASTRRFYVLNLARWLRGELDDESWEQRAFG